MPIRNSYHRLHVSVNSREMDAIACRPIILRSSVYRWVQVNIAWKLTCAQCTLSASAFITRHCCLSFLNRSLLMIYSRVVVLTRCSRPNPRSGHGPILPGRLGSGKVPSLVKFGVFAPLYYQGHFQEIVLAALPLGMNPRHVKKFGECGWRTSERVSWEIKKNKSMRTR